MKAQSYPGRSKYQAKATSSVAAGKAIGQSGPIRDAHVRSLLGSSCILCISKTEA